MITYETISTIALVLTSLISLSAILAPVIVNKKAEKLKLKEKRLELFYSEYHKAFTDLTAAYGEFKENFYKKEKLLSSIYSVMLFCNEETKQLFTDFADLVCEHPDQSQYCADLDECFSKCINAIHKEFYANL